MYSWLGASTPEEKGGYYSWGETEVKETYEWTSYIHCDGSLETNHDLGSDIAGTQYDVAHVQWGGSWVMPSYTQINELYEKCSASWTTVNGVNFRIFTGPNGGTISLPAAGLIPNYDIDLVGPNGSYWSSTQHPSYPQCTYGFFFNADNTSISGPLRFFGQSVRPVIDVANNINVSTAIPNASNQAIYNIYGIKVADKADQLDCLPSGIYIVNGKKHLK